MKIEFQEDLLKFLAQRKEAKKYVEVLEDDLFDMDHHKAVFSLIKGFVKHYRTQPSLGNLLEYFDREVKQSKFKGEDLSDVYAEVEEAIRDVYTVFTANTEQIREIIIEEYQLKLMRNLFLENAGKLKGANADFIKEVFRKVTDIKKIGDNDLDEEQNRGIFALSQFQKGRRSITEGSPTYLNALNEMTSTKGFYSPQLVIFMGGPKGFKTGTILNIAMNYVRDGKKVYYVDCENGEGRLTDRFYQAMLEATWSEYSSGDLDDVLEEMVGRFMAMGGDFKTDFFPAHTKTVADVEAELDYLRDEYGWSPDIIFWDYPDLMQPIDYRIHEKRLKIQAVYFDIIRLQKKLGVFGIGLSQVSKDAVNKPVIDMTGFAEDFGKAANCHAAFALCRTEEEKDAQVMRIVPVVQRDGVAAHSKTACFVEIDEGCMKMREISKEEWKRRVDAIIAANPKKDDKKKPINKSGKVPQRPKTLSDE